MIKVCKAICITHLKARKYGEVCNETATREHSGRPVCWLHHRILASGSRRLRFEGDPIPDFRRPVAAAAGAR